MSTHSPSPARRQRYRVQQDPRFWLQQIKRNGPSNVDSFGGGTGSGFEISHWGNKKTKRQQSGLKKDWSVSLGAAGATVGAGMYPAKFSFFPVGSPTCIGAGSDYVAFNIQGVNSSTTQASIIAYNNLYATTCTGTNPLVYWAYNTGRRTVTDAVTSSGSTTLTSATANFTAADLGAAVSGTNIASGTTITTVTNSTTVTLSADATGASLVVTFQDAASVATSVTLTQNGNEVAFVQNSGTTSTASLVLLKWNQTSATHASGANGHTTTGSTTITNTGFFIVATDVGAQISGTGIPAGATITAVASTTSATISAAATSTNTTDTFSITTETATTPGVPPTVSNANFHACTAPCMTRLTFSGGDADTNSAPLYDLSGSDLLFAGDNAGRLHKFQNVFTGTPSEVTTTWPVTVSNNAESLTSPVYDATSQLVFVGDAHASGNTTDGELHSLTLTGTKVDSPQVCHGVGYIDGPLLDPAAEKIYVGCGHDGGGTGSTECNGSSASACVRQFTETVSSALTTPAIVGEQNDAVLYTGAFDDQYFTSVANPPTGHLYVCGWASGSLDPTLYQIPITGTGLGTAVVATTPSTSSTTCSPVTEVFNPNVSPNPPNPPFDFLFLSVEAGGQANGCAGGACVMNFIATQWQATHAFSLGQEVLDNLAPYHIQRVTTAGISGATEPGASWNHSGSTTTDGTVHWTDEGTMIATGNSSGLASSGGSSAISIDNVSGSTGASQIYFSSLTGATAVQAAQTGP